MAIDYKEQWNSLCARHGDKVILTTAAGHRATLKDVMDSQIRVTIFRREKLMDEFIKERIITTNIADGTKNSHLVDIIFRGRQLDRVSVNKEDFQKWVDAKRGSCEPCVIRNIT